MGLVSAPSAPAAPDLLAPTVVGVASNVATDQIIVHARPSVAGLSRTTLGRLAGQTLRGLRVSRSGTYVVKLARTQRGATLNGTMQRLSRAHGVTGVEPDLKMFPAVTPNDSLFGSQWDLRAPVAGVVGINAPAAWDVTTGSTAITVAVIDTGYLDHADLAGRFVPGYDFVSDPAIGNDGNGRDPDARDPGDWVSSAESASGYFAGCGVSNSSWHGTHVSGTIGAIGNNSFGVTGINWVSKVLPVRVLGKCGGYTSDIVDGMRWAAGLPVNGVPLNPNKARVINLSLGGGGACTSTWQNAINEITAAGTVVVVAAGNSNANAANYTPASCANVITVASTGKAGKRAYYSNYGATVEIAAPGGDASADGGDAILSTLNTGTTSPVADTYARYQGTSMATPHIVGAVSLMLSVNPALTPAQILAFLQGTATAFPAGSTCTISLCGAGIVNAAAAVSAALAGVVPPPTTTTTTTTAPPASTTTTTTAPPATTTTTTTTAPPASTSTTTTTTTPAAGKPGAFAKTSPANGATGVSTTVTLFWSAAANATSYQVCVDTSNDNACSGTWFNAGTVRAVRLTAAVHTTYYWQVRATNALGTTLANAGAWWSLTTA